MRTKALILFLASGAFLFSCSKEGEKISAPSLEVSIPSVLYFVDEPVEFSFEGNADLISFWSGESGNDYAWRDADRIYQGEASLSFGSAFMNGQQWKHQALANPSDKLVTFLWSDDFDGDYTQAGVSKATWHDATNLFTFASARVNDARNLASATASGTVSLSDIIPSLGKGPYYFAFRYHLTPVVDAATDSRSRAVISNFTINCVNDSLHVKESVVTNSSAGWSFVNIGYNDSDSDYMPEASASYIFFNSSTANTAERWSWAISKPYTPELSINLGCDYAMGIKSFSDSPMKGYTWSYSKPGVYEAVFVSRNVSADGNTLEKVQRLTFGVSERGGAIIDTPEQKEW